MKKRTVLLLSLAALILLGALCLQAGLFAHENQQPYSLYWDGQLYRSYAEEWKEPVTEDALIGKTDAVCPGSRIPDAHGEANCLLEGTVIARAEDKLLAQVDDGWWIFSPVK